MSSDREFNREKGRKVIGEALARTMYDTPLHVLEVLRKNGGDSDSVNEIAKRVARELEYSRWQIKGPPRTDTSLAGLINSALRMSSCQRIASANLDVAKSARNEAVENICGSLRDARVTLVQWRRR